MRERRLPLVLACLSAAALALRVIYLVEIRLLLFFDHPVVDAAEYVRWAQEIAPGHLLWTSLQIHGPLYPFFLSAVFAVSPDNFLLVGVLQSIVGVGSAWIAALIARELAQGWIAPIVSFCAIAFGWVFVCYDGQWMPTTFIVFFDLLGAWCTLRAWSEEGRLRHGLGAGLAFAASALAWGPGLLLLPLSVLCIAVSRTASGPRLARAGACLLAGGLLLAPVAWRNRSVSGKWVLTQGNAWLNAYIGNHEGATGMPSFQPGQQWQELRLSLAPNVEQTAAWRVRRFWSDTPREAARLLARKAEVLLANAEADPSQDLGYFREASRALSLPWLASGVLIPLGMAGLLLGLSTHRGRRLAALAAGAMAVPLAFSVCSRYRLPWEALLAPFCGLLFARIARRPWSAVVLVVALALGWVSFSDPAGVRHARLFRTHDYLAHILHDDGRLQEALDEEEIELQGGDIPDALFELASIQRDRGERLAALAILNRMRIGPDWPTPPPTQFVHDVARLRVDVLVALGRMDDAERCARWSARLPDPDPRNVAQYGEVLRRRGKLDEAIAELRKAVRFKPPCGDAYVGLGAALGAKKEYAEAADVLAQAVQIVPNDRYAHYNLAVACHLLRRDDEAIREAERARELGHPDADKLLRLLRR